LSAPEFHRQINGGKMSLTLDFGKPEDIARLMALIKKADIVIEGSRPRALRQLGINAEQCVEQVPGLTWLSITGYGRQSPQENWVAFGDDAAIAGGLAVMDDYTPNFVGDAIGDPLTGIHAAVAGLIGWNSGAGSLMDVSLVGVASYVRQHIDHVKSIDLKPD
jgi:crotonobetainyl-CoA:carnitine CoA-transferase CaiB-like acyl-CoA transferase